jgi:benzodiazapine receptor
LNAAWVPLFFGARNIGAGLFVIVALWLAIVWTIREFLPVRPLAAWLMLPYWAWVSFSMALNFSIWRINQ